MTSLQTPRTALQPPKRAAPGPTLPPERSAPQKGQDAPQPSPDKSGIGDGVHSVQAHVQSWLPALVPSSHNGTADAVARTLVAWLHSHKTRSENTGRNYGRVASAFLNFIEPLRGTLPDGLLQSSPSDVKAFINLDPSHSPATRALKLAILRSMFGALVVEELMARNPAADVKVKRVQSGQHHKAVPRSLILRLLVELRASERPKDVRDHALIVTFLAVGARRAEVAALKVSDIEREEDGKSYLRLLGKGDRLARMLLREGTLRAIDRWLKVGGHGGKPTNPLFYNLSHRPDHRERRSLSSNGIWHIVKRRFGKYSPHGLRARSISDVWQRSDQNLHMAQVFARHSSPTVTEQVYVQAEKLDIAMTYAPDYE